MERIGLVFTGGGGKGAYQIGVWKAFREFGIDKHIAAVSGASVGALNLALFLQGNLEKAENIWLNISPEKILNFSQEKFLENLETMFHQKFNSDLIKKVISNGSFTRNGLLELFRKEVDLKIISKSKIPFYVACVNAVTFEPVSFKLNGRPTKYIKSVLLASSAIPGVFDSVEIHGERYLDGGFGTFSKTSHKLVLPLYEEGCKVIIVVHLNKKNLINHSLYPDAQIIEITPQHHQGGIFNGMLDFTSAGSKRRINQGYDDTIKILKPVADMVSLQQKIQEKLISLKAYEQQLRQQIEPLLPEMNRLKNMLGKLKNSEEDEM